CKCAVLSFFFFFQAEDGIRDFHVTGVQTCALPISRCRASTWPATRWPRWWPDWSWGPRWRGCWTAWPLSAVSGGASSSRAWPGRSEERRVGKEGGARGDGAESRKKSEG